MLVLLFLWALLALFRQQLPLKPRCECLASGVCCGLGFRAFRVWVLVFRSPGSGFGVWASAGWTSSPDGILPQPSLTQLCVTLGSPKGLKGSLKGSFKG